MLINLLVDRPSLKVVVLDLESVDRVDATGEAALRRIAERLQTSGIDCYFARTKCQVYTILQRSGLVAELGAERFFRERKQALQYARQRWGEGLDISPFLQCAFTI